MKKVKIMLSAIAVLAVVGGALAFKAQKFTASAVFCKVDNVCQFAGFQTAKIDNVATTTIPCGDVAIQYYTTNAANCTINGVTPTTTKTLYLNDEQ